MSVLSEIERIDQNVANTYAVLSALGAEMPEKQNSDNLASTAGTAKAVLYSPQTLTAEQQAQARDNIDALSSDDVDAVLQQARESGQFDGAAGKDGANGKDGADGQRGTGILKVTTAPSSYTTAIGSYTPKYRIALSTVKTQSGKDEVLIGDLIQYSYYQYHVDYLDDTYAYISATRVSIRGATGAEGAAGATGPQGPTGPAGPAGSDATVTADSIKSALGYTPADEADLTALNNEKVAYYGGSVIQKPQTHIINNVQDSTTYRGSGIAVDTTDYILGDRSVRVSGTNAYIRWHKNYSPYSVNLKDNLLVLKIKINSIDANAQMYVKVGNSTNASNLVPYSLMRNVATTVYGEWQEFTFAYNAYSVTNYTNDISAIDFENIDDIFVLVTNGAADFNVQFIGYRPNQQSKGVVSFTFDDGWKTAADGIKALAEKGATGTLYVIEEATGADYLTVAEMQKLVKLYGTDIEAHGGTEYQNMTDAQLIEHWASIKNFLRENGLGSGNHLAYPGGMNPTRVYNLAKKYFQSCRTIEGFAQLESFPPCDAYRMRATTSVSQNGSNNATRIKEYIDHAAESKTWLILVFHKIDDGIGSESCNMATFKEIVDYAVNADVDIMNIAEVFDTRGHSTNIANITNAVINALPVYNGEVE